MNNISATVNPRELLLMFAELDSKNQKKAHKTALINSSRILVNEAKRNFKSVVKKPNSKNRWNGRPMNSGIKYSIDKNVTTSKIHIMGDFRLKFFELGTKKRFKRNKQRSNTGSIAATYFFKNAREAKEGSITEEMNNIISKSILKVNEKYRNR